jgi:hypothetical protein
MPSDNSSDANAVGIGRTVAFALAALDLDVVQRTTIRRLLPVGTTRRSGPGRAEARRRKGDTQGSVNRTSETFGIRLKKFEDRGWIARDGVLLRVINRAALLDCALGGQQDTPLPLLQVAETIEEIRRDQRNREVLALSGLIEQRRRELQALARLMQEPVTGQHRSGIRSVRITHKPPLI